MEKKNLVSCLPALQVKHRCPVRCDAWRVPGVPGRGMGRLGGQTGMRAPELTHKTPRANPLASPFSLLTRSLTTGIAAAMSEAKKSTKFLKPGKVVVMLKGRMAGKKAVIVKSSDDGTPDRPYGHCIVAGIMKYPLKITKSMPDKKIAKRSRVRCAAAMPNSRSQPPCPTAASAAVPAILRAPRCVASPLPVLASSARV